MPSLARGGAGFAMQAFGISTQLTHVTEHQNAAAGAGLSTSSAARSDVGLAL